MCADPVTMAIIGGGKAMLGNYSAVQAASARNKNRKKLYDMEKLRTEVEHNQNINKYYLRGVDAEYAWADNAIAASRAAEKEQVVLNQEIARALQQNETDYVKSLQSPLLAKSLEKTGVSARRMRKAVKAAVGRGKAARSAGQDMARDRAALVFDEIKRIKDKADRDADLMIGLEPMRGPGPATPTWDKGPSAFQQFANIAIGAATSYMGAKAGVGSGGDIGKETLTDEAISQSFSMESIGIADQTLMGTDLGVDFSSLGGGVDADWMLTDVWSSQSQDIFRDVLKSSTYANYGNLMQDPSSFIPNASGKNSVAQQNDYIRRRF